jgi:hypothetical protein
MFNKIMTVTCLLILPALATAAAPLDEYVRDGRIQEGLSDYASPRTDADRFSLAVLQVMEGVQQFSVQFNELGMRQDSPLSFLPFMRIVVPTPKTAITEPATPKMAADVFRSFRQSLRDANATLGKIGDDDFGVELNLTRASLDFDGDGLVDETETVLTSLGAVLGERPGAQSGDELVIRFDAADAIWLKGYTHFVSGILDILLAYDWRPVWDQCAHLLFANPDPRPSFNRWAGPGQGFGDWADMIAAVHEMRLELKDKKAWPRARDEFQNMFASSRLCWGRVLSEIDDDREWLPSPSQTGPQGATVTQEQIDGWMLVLDELDAIMTGEKLLPHWRVRPGAGINIDKLVDSPPPLDLVMWIHGFSLQPYLEDGPVSDEGTWDNLTQPFGPGFMQFAIWSN